MSGQNFILSYVSSCASGKLGIAECGPVWQILVIAVFLIVAVVALIVLRLRPRAQSGQS
jgi:maltodextrin utilization protein YvdJ